MLQHFINKSLLKEIHQSLQQSFSRICFQQQQYVIDIFFVSILRSSSNLLSAAHYITMMLHNDEYLLPFVTNNEIGISDLPPYHRFNKGRQSKLKQQKQF